MGKDPTDLDRLKHLLHTMEGPITAAMRHLLTIDSDWREAKKLVKKIEEEQC